MYLVGFAWTLLLGLWAAVVWSGRRLRAAGHQEVCDSCGYQRVGLRTSAACPECAGTAWVRGHERQRAALVVERLAVALFAPTIGLAVMGSVALGMQPKSLPHSAVVAGASYSLLMLVLGIRYRFHVGRRLLRWSVGTGVGGSVPQGLVAAGYWSAPPSDDFGWPLTDIVLVSLVCFVFALIVCTVIWGITAPPGAYVGGHDGGTQAHRTGGRRGA